MYVATKNKEHDTEKALQVIKDNPFGTLVSTDANGLPMASHIPFELIENEDGSFSLHGHVAKANPIWQTWVAEPTVLAIFMAHHAYISASWYEKLNVSTWNYRATHLYGTIRLMNDTETRKALAHLTQNYEQGRENANYMERMSEDFIQAHLEALVAFEIKITKIEAAAKLSQNRNDKDYKNIINELGKSDVPDDLNVAKDMQQNRP